MPYIKASEEVKSKPAQNAVRDLREVGIYPDILVARADHDISSGIIEKLSLFTGISKNAVVPMPTVDTIYRVPIMVEDLGVGSLVCQYLDLKDKKPNLKNWNKLVKTVTDKNLPVVKVGVVAKYLDHQDTYASVVEAAKSAAWSLGKKAQIFWIDAEKVNDATAPRMLSSYEAIIVPGCFGERGVDGKITAAKYCLTHDLPYLGLCLGMQVSAIAAARLGCYSKANSTEFDPATKDPVIDLMESQKMVAMKGGTMRLGNYDCQLEKGSKAAKLYGATKISERHMHRYEFNSDYEKIIEKSGLRVVGKNPQTGLAEVVEGTNNRYFVATQYHPEFKSRPLQPQPLFVGLIKSARAK